MSKMILIDEATVKLAIDALDRHQSIVGLTNNKQDVEAIIALRKTLTAQPAQQQEPVFWYRPCSNGMYEGPIHNAQIERVRKESGAWHPLYTSPPAAQQEPVAWPIDGDTAKRIADRVCVSYETVQQVARELAAPQPAQQQEPVAWATRMGEYAHIHWGAKRPEYPMVYEVPLYTSPPAQRKPLTDEEIDAIGAKIFNADFLDVEEIHANRDIARAIEAAHGIKEQP